MGLTAPELQDFWESLNVSERQFLKDWYEKQMRIDCAVTRQLSLCLIENGRLHRELQELKRAKT